MTNLSSKLISVAPMIDWTDKHFRYLLRLISPHVWLYTEMITSQALFYAKKESSRLRFDTSEHPLALQLGGSDPVLLQKAAQLGEEAGFDEINLNVGCPSPRVTSGRFGVCLMMEPLLVARAVALMKETVSIPVTVKCRIGVDHNDQYEFLYQFIQEVASSGCDTFIVHARKAWLKGLSPKQNREIPPLNYETVCQLKKDFAALTIIINGGFKTIEAMRPYLDKVDGCMIGRIVCENPYFLADIESSFFNHVSQTRIEVVYNYLHYMEKEMGQGAKLSSMARFLLNLFHGVPGAAEWRRYLSEHMHQDNCQLTTIDKGLAIFDRC